MNGCEKKKEEKQRKTDDDDDEMRLKQKQRPQIRALTRLKVCRSVASADGLQTARRSHGTKSGRPGEMSQISCF